MDEIKKIVADIRNIITDKTDYSGRGKEATVFYRVPWMAQKQEAMQASIDKLASKVNAMDKKLDKIVKKIGA